MEYININGNIVAVTEACIPYANAGFRLGYGIFETILVKDGSVELATFHSERLFEGIKQLCFGLPGYMTEIWLEDEVMRTVRKNGMEKLCRVRLQVYRGRNNTTLAPPEFIMECFELDPALLQLNKTGLNIGIAKGLQKSTDSLSNLKTSSALIYSMAMKQAEGHGWSDALICNVKGNIAESSIANIFCIRGGQIYTPPLNEGCIAGVKRRQLLEELPLKGYTITEQSFTRAFLADADEVFLTNAIRGIKWVSSIGDKHYNNNIINDIAAIMQ